MDVTSVTVGIPVTDLQAARPWYEALLERSGPDLEPVEGVVEYQIGPVWLQLTAGEARPGMIVRIGVSDVHAERQRLLARGINVPEPTVIEDVIAFCDFEDPDGNLLSLYTEEAPPEPCQSA